jgi:phosphatidylserine decarboxylase
VALLLRSKGHWPREAEFTAAPKFVALDHPDPPKRFPIEFERKSFYSPGLATCAGASLGNAEVLKHVLHPIHPDGWKFVAIFVAVTLGLFFLWEPLGWVGVVASAWCVYFFRDPPRVTPQRAGLVVSPADGLVVSVGSSFPPIELEMGMRPMTKIGIFLNVFDVHINRAPIGGTVERTRYHKGQFVNASFDKASELNERMAIRLTTGDGADIAVVQIAGLVARRIVCQVSAGQRLLTGERFGLIRFGSRTDLYVPEGWSVQVMVGQRVIGGETIIADAQSAELPRVGVIR